MKDTIHIVLFVLKLVFAIAQLISINTPKKVHTYNYSKIAYPVMRDSVIAKFKAMHQVRMDTNTFDSLAKHKLK